MNNLKTLNKEQLVDINGGCDAECEGYRVGYTLGKMTKSFLYAAKEAFEMISPW